MRNAWRKAAALWGAYYAYMLEYRAEMVLWSLTGVLPLILMGVWMKAAAAGGFGMSPQDFARYFFAVFLVRQITVVWFIWEFEFLVVEGRLSPHLLQPIDPVWRHVAMHLAEKATRLPLLGLFTLAFFLAVPGAARWPAAGALVQAGAALALAWTVRFAIQYTFAMCNFWTERASALEQVWFLGYLFLSGTIAPLEVFPPALRQAVLFTPFPWLLHFPARLLAEQPTDFAAGMAILAAWGAGFAVLGRVLWHRGLRRYSAMGA